MIVSLIAAIAADNSIGRDNDLLWSLPADMKFFKSSTKGHTVLMGRKNYESIPERFRPLPSRVNIVVSRNANYEGCLMVRSIEEGLKAAEESGEEELFVIGGGEIYRQTIDLADRLYISHVDAQYPEADAHFPFFEKRLWEEVELAKHEIDERHEHVFRIVQYNRKNA